MSSFDSIGALPVSALTASVVVWIAPDANLQTLCQVLADADVGAVVVGGGGRVMGVASERDIVRAVAEGRSLVATEAANVASTSIVWCTPSSTVTEVAAEMLENYVRHVLVQENGELVGIVSARDLLGAYAAFALSGVADASP